MRTGIIYCATSPCGKKYIGRTIQSIEKRKYSHNSSVRKGSNLFFHNAIRKYGIENFSWDILVKESHEDPVELIKTLNKKEIEFINKENTFWPAGYNLNKGGGNYTYPEYYERKGKSFEEIFGEEKAQKIKKRMSKGLKGKTRGRKCSKKEIEKRSISNTGKKRTEKTKEKICNSLLGTRHTVERRKNISESLKKSNKVQGVNNPAYKKISIDIQNKIIDLHVNERWSSRKLEREFGYSYSKILRFLRSEGIYKSIYLIK
jgi:group I intron endonuclease